MSTTPLKDAIDRINADGDRLELAGGRDEHGKAEAGLEAWKDIGERGGWALGGAVNWIQDKGARILGKITWRPGERR